MKTVNICSLYGKDMRDCITCGRICTVRVPAVFVISKQV